MAIYKITEEESDRYHAKKQVDKFLERFKKAVKAAIEDFAKTSRVKINNEAYGQLQSIMQQGQESIF